MDLKYLINGKTFYYEVFISGQDIVEYLTPSYMGLDENEMDIFKCGIQKVLNQEWLNFEKLEDDEFFVEFMTKKYQHDAEAYYKEKYENED